MADIFGDLNLFAEFDRDREAQGSFIHYDEDGAKSRIVFEDFESGDEDDSEDECGTSTDVKGRSAGRSTGEESLGRSEIKMQVDSDNSESMKANDGRESSEGEEKINRRAVDYPSSNGSAGNNKTITDQSKLTMEKEEKEKWLNEQLYAEAAEEATQSNINTHQLIFERNKYRRFAKIVDSTRYTPDEESPAVQLLFNNNSFARKYRQQIEQFIKGLLWEEFHSNNQESTPEITAKPGVPSCIDINNSLPSEKRNERMRQKHALIGNSQFHKQFLIDFLGWPFTVAEPTRCNVNWEIPLYGQVFNEVYADPSSTKANKKQKKQKPACWNCGEENHAVNECKQPRNPSKIAANRKEFLAQQQQNQTEPKFSGPSRYHMDPELASKFSRFKPGIVSDGLRKALGLQQDQLPQHVYKMRLYGYPPGWLAEAKKVQSGMSIFDKNGRVTLITGECLEDGELDDGGAEKTEYDINKIIEYPGFTVPVPLGFVEEYETFKMPPIQQHQLKKTLMSQSTEKASAKKRKREKNQEERKKKVKKAKTEEEGEEGEVTDEEDDDTQPLGDENESETNDTDKEVATSSNNSNNIQTTPGLNRSTSSTISISKDYGTPILTREKSDLPDASKFGKGIEEHIPFENLPNSTGTFEKMKGLIDIIRSKFKK